MVLDELGRGTATLDGAAIAGAVLDELASAPSLGCRGLFATHYHHLSDSHADDPRVAVMHMACAIAGQETEDDDLSKAGPGKETAAVGGSGGGGGDGKVEQVTFLYKLTQGEGR